MVTKVTDETTGASTIHFAITGGEADYAAIMKALTIGISCINQHGQKYLEARQTLASLLIEILPCESILTIKENANNNIRAAKVS